MAEASDGVVAKVVEDGKPVILSISRGEDTEDNKAVFPWLAVIAWKYTGDGMPSKEVNEKMMEFEDILEDVLVTNKLCVHAVSRTGNGLKEWEYYIQDQESFMDAFNKALSDHERYPIEITFYHDPQWEELQRFVAVIGQ